MTKPHKFEVNSTKPGSLTHLIFVWTINGQSRKIKYFFRVRRFQIFYSISVCMSSCSE
jgi:hypothetical protein